MKTLIAAIGLTILLTVPAQAERVRHQGSFFIVSKTENGKCDEYDPVGDRGVASLRPKITGNPDNDNTRIGWFYQSGARGFQTDGAIGSAYKVVESVNVFEGFDQPQPKQQMKFTSQKPATIKDSTQVIDITGNILNYDFMAGCEIKFRMVVQKRPD